MAIAPMALHFVDSCTMIESTGYHRSRVQHPGRLGRQVGGPVDQTKSKSTLVNGKQIIARRQRSVKTRWSKFKNPLAKFTRSREAFRDLPLLSLLPKVVAPRAAIAY